MGPLRCLAQGHASGAVAEVGQPQGARQQVPGCPPPGLGSAPAAGCPRVNESLLLLQTISDIFADNATLSPACPPATASPGSTSLAAPAPRAAPTSPPPAFGPTVHPGTSPRHLAPAPFSALAAQSQSQAEQPAPLAAL